MLDTLFLQILNMSFTASIVIIFVILVQLVLKKAPRIFSYVLWSVVLFRLVMSTLNPPSRDIIETWKQIKISDVTILNEDIRENKAAFELSVTVKEAPDGLGMWTPGTLP